MTLTADDVLRGIVLQAREWPRRPAVKDLTRELTYQDLGDEVERVARGFAGRGVKKGDRVAIHLPNSVDFVVSALASMWLGALFVPLSISDPDARLSVMLDDCAPALIVVPDDKKTTSSTP